MNKIDKNDKTGIDMRDYVIEITFPDGSLGYAGNQVTAAKNLGCTKAMVGQHLNHPDKYKSCKGCKLRYIDLLDLVNNSQEECK